MQLSKDTETFLTVAKYFNVPPLELYNYPQPMYDAMVVYLDGMVKEDQKKRLHAKAMANLGRR